MNKKYTFSYFLLSLETRQFFREKYGYFRKKQLLKLFDAVKKPLSYYKVGILLEMHLGRILVSSCFVPSYASARQLISHGHVNINGHPVSTLNCKLQLGDIISVNSSEGRFRTNLYWLQAIEKLFLEDFRLRNFGLKNFSDKKGAIVPVFNRGGFKLSKWRNVISSLDKKVNRPIFNYGSIKYKNKHSLFLDSISKRYGGWTYKNFRWFPPSWTKKWNSDSKVLTFKEIVAKRKERNRLFWSLTLGRQNKVKEGLWSKNSSKGYKILFSNLRHVIYMQSSYDSKQRSKIFKAENFRLQHSKNMRKNLPINLVIHDKKYKRFLSKTKQGVLNNEKILTLSKRLNFKDGFNSTFFSGLYSSRWLSFSKVVKGISNRISFIRFHRKYRIYNRKKVKIAHKKLRNARFTNTNFISLFSFFNKNSTLANSFLKKRQSRYHSKFKIKSKKLTYRKKNFKSRFENQKSNRTMLKTTKDTKVSVNSRDVGINPRASFYPKLFRPSVLKNQGNNVENILQHKFNLVLKYSHLYKDYRIKNSKFPVATDFLVTRFFKSLPKKGLDLKKGTLTKSPLKFKIMNKTDNDKVMHMLILTLQQLVFKRSLRTRYLHRLFSRYSLNTFLNLVRFYFSYKDLFLSNSNKNLKTITKDLFREDLKNQRSNLVLLETKQKLFFLSIFRDLIKKYGENKSEYISLLSLKRLILGYFIKRFKYKSGISSAIKDYSVFKLKNSRLNYSLDRKAISKLFYLRSKEGLVFYKNLKLSTKKQDYKFFSSDVLQNQIYRARKQVKFYEEWRFNKMFRVLSMYKHIKKKKKSILKRVDLRTLIYKITYFSFLALQRRYIRFHPENVKSKGHPLKSIQHFLPDKKKLNYRKRYLKAPSLRNYNGFLSWKNRFRHWYRKRSRNKAQYKGSIANKYVFNRFLKKMYFTLYNKPIFFDEGKYKYRYFSKLFFLGRVKQAQNDLLFRLPPKYLEVDSSRLAITILRYPYANEMFRDLPVKIPQDILGMFLKPKH